MNIRRRFLQVVGILQLTNQLQNKLQEKSTATTCLVHDNNVRQGLEQLLNKNQSEGGESCSSSGTVSGVPYTGGAHGTPILLSMQTYSSLFRSSSI